MTDVRRSEHVWGNTGSQSHGTRSLRAPGPACKPGALRSLDVCLDSKSPFIDAGRFRFCLVVQSIGSVRRADARSHPETSERAETAADRVG